MLRVWRRLVAKLVKCIFRKKVEGTLVSVLSLQ